MHLTNVKCAPCRHEWSGKNHVGIRRFNTVNRAVAVGDTCLDAYPV